MRHSSGYNLIELLIVIAIIAFLSAISIPSFMRFLAKSKRAEAYVTLRALYVAEKGYHLDNGRYTAVITAGQDGAGWKPEGALLYTYGFPGSEGTNFVSGTLQAPASALQGAQASPNAFVIAAAADIDGDGVYDVLTIDQNGVITLVTDDLS